MIFVVGDMVKWLEAGDEPGKVTYHYGMILEISNLTGMATVEEDVIDEGTMKHIVPLKSLSHVDDIPKLSNIGKLLGMIEMPEAVTALSNAQLLGLFRRINNKQEFGKEVEQLEFHLTKEILDRMKRANLGGYDE